MTIPLSLSGTREIIAHGGVVVARSTLPAHATARMEIAWLLDAVHSTPGRLIDKQGFIDPVLFDSAIRDYQKSHHLTVDGQIGPRSFALLSETLAQHMLARVKAVLVAKANPSLVTHCNPFGLANYDGSPSPAPCPELQKFTERESQHVVSHGALNRLREAFSLFSKHIIGDASTEASPPAVTPDCKTATRLEKYRG